MSKKPHPLESVENIFGALKEKTAPPSPAPSVKPSKTVEVTEAPPSTGQKGRPANGKKSNTEYCQTTISIRKQTRTRVQKSLLGVEPRQDMSDLVEELLGKWLDSQID